MAPLLAVLLTTRAQAQPVHVAGQLLLDLSSTRGLNTNTGMSSVAGETNVITWTNYGLLGGKFDSALTSVYAATIPATTNPPTLTNYAGVYAPASPAGSRMMVANFNTPAQLLAKSAYSVECWFYNLTTADPRGVFAWTLAAPPAGDAGELGAAATASWHNDANSLLWKPDGAFPSTSTWHYGVITYNGSTESVYLDGVLSNSAVHTLNIVGTNAGALPANPVIFSQLGAIPSTGTSSSFNGAIASLRVHTDALTAADVANNFAAGIAAVSSPINLSIQTAPVSAIVGTPLTPGSATLNANLQATADPSTTVLTFFYDTTDHGRTTNGWANSVGLAAPNSVGAFSANISGLAQGTIYYVRAYAANATDTNLSSVVTFRTLGKPLINNSTDGFTGPGTYGVSSVLSSEGDGSGAADVKVYWGTNDGGLAAGNWTNVLDLGPNGVGTVTNTLSGLVTEGKYYYTFSSANGYGEVFASPSVSFQEGLIFAVNTSTLPTPSLPPAAAVPTGNWVSSVGPPLLVQQGTPTVHDFGGVPWVQSHFSTGDGFRQGNYASAVPANGGSIVLAVRPTGGGATGNWSSLVDIMFDQLSLTINPVGAAAVAAPSTNAHIAGFQVWAGVNVGTPRDTATTWPNGQRNSHIYIPSNAVTILSLVATADNNFILYTNGVVATNTLTGSNPAGATQINLGGLTSFVPASGGRPYATFINVLRENPDTFSVYNGYLGDVAVFGEAISDATRQALEAQMTAKFVTAATLSYGITASVSTSGTPGDTTGGTINTPGLSGPGITNVIQGNDVTYTIAPNNGFGPNVTVDGVSQGLLLSYTFVNVSAAHTISVAYTAIPSQTITASVTGGTGGAVSPSGLVNVSGGANQSFSIQPNNGFKVNALTVDGTNALGGTTVNNSGISIATGSYTFANVGANGIGPAHTIAVTFTALSLPVPKSDQLLFSVDTAGLLPVAGQTVSGTAITNWSVYVPSTLPGLISHFTAAPTTFIDGNGTLWDKNVEIENGTSSTGMQLGATTLTTQPNIPVNGATIVCAASPIRGGTSEAWNDIVDVYFKCLTVGIRDDTGAIQVMVNRNGGIANNYTTPYMVPSGTNVIISLVVQPAGGFAVYANTVMVFTNAGTGAYTKFTPGIAGNYANNIDIGTEQPDNWSGFNGLIGDVFVYGTALSDTDRGTLEQALITKFHAVVPPNCNWAGPNNGDWSSVANWSNTVAGAINSVPGAGNVAVFSVTNTAGQTVQVDTAGITVAGLAFNSNGVNTIIASTSGNTLTLDSTSAASAAIFVSAGSSPAISANLSVVEGLDITGPGTLNLSGTVQLLGTPGTGYLGIAPNGSATAILSLNGGMLTTSLGAQSWAVGNGPGVMLGGADNSATHATLDLNGGVLLTPNIGCVTEDFSVGPNVLVPPATFGATAVLNLNGGVLQASDSDPTFDTFAVLEGSAHLIFNTTHTWVQAGGAKIDTQGFADSIAVPLEHFPGGPALDGGLTKMGTGTLTLLTNSTYTGPTRIQAGILACETTASLGGNSVDISSGAVLQLDYTGTTPVYKLTINGGAPLPAGTYGATGSGAANIDNTHFAGVGTLTVLGTVVAPIFTSMAITGGNLVLQGTGGVSGGSYLLLGTTNVALPLANWTTIATGTFTGGGFSLSVPVNNAVPQNFVTLVVP